MKWIGHVRCEKTRCNFGSTKWCIVCTPKPDLTTGTSQQRNRAKPPRNLVLGLKKWIGQFRCEKNKTQLRKHKVVHFMHPKTRYHNLYLPAKESRETTQKHCFWPKEVDWACSLQKKRRNFGSTKWCILCTPKPILTTGTSRQRNRGKPPKNLVLGLKKWIGQDRSEKNKTQLRKHKVLHFMHPKTRSHNLYLPATESCETTQKLSFGNKKVDWASSL